MLHPCIHILYFAGNIGSPSCKRHGGRYLILFLHGLEFQAQDGLALKLLCKLSIKSQESGTF